MALPRVKRRASRAREEVGVYADLDELIRLQFLASGFSFLPRQPVHSVLMGRRRSHLRGRGLNFEELRRYLPGDDARRIDWRVTARTGRPHVRVYTEEKDRPVLLLVDQRRSMFFGSQRALKSVAAAEAAALGAWRALSVGDRVGGLVFSDSGLDETRPQRSERAVVQLLRNVVARNHELDASLPGEPEMLNRALARAARLLHHDALLVLISDCLGADAATVRHLTGIAAHNDVLLILVHDPLEVELPALGARAFGAGDQQLEVDTDDAQLRRRYAQSFLDQVERARLLARQRRIPLLPLSTHAPVPEQVRRALGHVSGRG